MSRVSTDPLNFSEPYWVGEIPNGHERSDGITGAAVYLAKRGRGELRYWPVSGKHEFTSTDRQVHIVLKSPFLIVDHQIIYPYLYV